jgi:uncharacterized delta-60 repeat protein
VYLATHTAGVGAAGDAAVALVVDGSDGLYVVGSSAVSDTSSRIVVWRLTANGAPDSSFNSLASNSGVTGGPGFAVLPSMTGATAPQEQATATTLDGAGNLLIAGSANGTSGIQEMFVASLSAGARVDFNTAFGNSGGGSGPTGVAAILTDLGGVNLGLSILADSSPTGGIWVGGQTSNQNTSGGATVWKLTAAGALDATFNAAVSPGVFQKAASVPQGRNDRINALARDGTGRILAAGEVVDPGNNSTAVVWAITPAGALDATFDASGAIPGIRAFRSAGPQPGTAPFLAQANAIAVDAQSRIVLAGSSGGMMAVWRVTAAGAPDATYASVGSAAYADAAAYANVTSGNAVLLDDAGNLLIGGTSSANGDTGPTAAALWRLTP